MLKFILRDLGKTHRDQSLNQACECALKKNSGNMLVVHLVWNKLAFAGCHSLSCRTFASIIFNVYVHKQRMIWIENRHFPLIKPAARVEYKMTDNSHFQTFQAGGRAYIKDTKCKKGKTNRNNLSNRQKEEINYITQTN